jgi:hypothetical protein
MATKTRKKTTKVQLDAATVHRFESALRDGLVSSGAVMMAENTKPKLKSRAKVELDPATTARLSEVLRHGLVAANARMAGEHAPLDKMTARVKGRPPRSRAKKSQKSR